MTFGETPRSYKRRIGLGLGPTTSFNVFRKDRETSTIGGGVFQISNEDLIAYHGGF